MIQYLLGGDFVLLLALFTFVVQHGAQLTKLQSNSLVALMMFLASITLCTYSIILSAVLAFVSFITFLVYMLASFTKNMVQERAI